MAKKARGIIMILLLLSIIATPLYAFSMIDNLLYKSVMLKAKNTQLMVNRLTGEVKYLLRSDGQWILLEGQWKDMYQKLYNAQGRQ